MALADCLRGWFRFVRAVDVVIAFLECFFRYHKQPKRYRIGTRSGKTVDWNKSYGRWEQTSSKCDDNDFFTKRRRWTNWTAGLPPSWRADMENCRHDPTGRFLYFASWDEMEYWKITRQIHERLYHRQLFVTDSGHLGIGPSELQEGDLMVLSREHFRL